MASEWKKFKDKMKIKRGTGRDVQKNDESTITKILENQCVVIQRLSQEVSGKAQKYSRIGAREFVPYHHDEVTIENIKSACVEHFMHDNMVCDILAGEQGPSCANIQQVPDLKLINIRFIDNSLAAIEIPSTTTSSTLTVVPKRRRTSKGPVASSANTPQKVTSTTSQSHFIPKSLSVLDMVKLGKNIDRSKTSVSIMSFDINVMIWSAPMEIDFLIADDMFSKGGFREAYLASSQHSDFIDRKWVVKKYLQKSLDIINATEQTVEQHTKKIVQTHILARNMAAKLAIEVNRDDSRRKAFGEVFHYNKIYYGFIKATQECVTVEEFIEGEFYKYVNNDGLCPDHHDILVQKAECLMHFTLDKSKDQLLLVDIQGCLYSLCDPEIASRSLIEDNQYLFTTGNLSSVAIDNFKLTHKCSKFCDILRLKNLIRDSSEYMDERPLSVE